ncbi:MAG: gliding motility-associated C-terminal domain-containing protein [Saprospiraceae bacterium]
MTNTTNNCSATFAVAAPADLAIPLAAAGTDQTLNCTAPNLQLDGTGSSTGSEFNYLWSGSGIVSGGTTLSPTVNAPGNYQLLVTNVQNGCTKADAVLILGDANQPVVQIAAPGILNCTTSQLNLNGAGSSTGNNFSYLWSGPGIVQGDTTLSLQINAPGDYTLVITNTTNGCTSTEMVAVTQNILLPPADAGPDNILNCTNPQLQIGGPNNPTGNGYTFTWSGPGIVSGNTTATPMVNAGGAYNVTVTNTANGCTQIDQTTIATDFVNPLADAGSTFQLTCTQNTYVLGAMASMGNNFSYAWSTMLGSFTTPTNILTPTVNGAGTYNLLVTNTTNGCTATSNVQITIAADVPAAVATTPGILTCTTQNLNLSGNGSSTGANFSYQWSATNGGNVVNGGTTLSPQVNQPGTYQLEVTDMSNNCVSTSSVTVDQNIATPVINAGQTPTLTCTNPSLSLEGSVSSTGSFTYLWSAQNGGNIVSGSSTLNPVVNAAGTYLLTVTSQQNGCTSTASVPALVNQIPPVSAIQQPDMLTCILETALLDATGSTTTGNMSYVWNAITGHLVGQPNGLTAMADQPGTYVLLITDQDNGCTSTASATVDQDVLLPTASAGSDGLLTCELTSLQLNGAGSSQNGSYFYEWSTQGGQISTGANGLSPTITAGGTYTLTVVNQSNGCSTTDVTLVTTDTIHPAVAIVSPGLITCVQPQVTINGSGSQGGANIVYAWTASQGNIVGATKSKNLVVDAPGIYNLNVLNTANGCSSTAAAQVTANIVLPLADAGAPFTLTCSVEQVTLQGSGSTGASYSYAWTAQSGGVIVSGANTPNPVVNQTGTYNLLVTNLTTGCKQTDNVQIVRETNIPTAFHSDLKRPSCKNNDGVIRFDTVIGGVGPYLFSIDGGQHFFTSIGFESITPGTYSLYIQVANGCEFSQNLVVPQAPTVNVTLIPEVKIDLGQSYEINATLPPGFPLALIDTVIWQPLEGLTFSGTDIQSLLHPVAKPFKPTEYTVRVITGDQCEATDRILIRVDNEPHVYIPNAFSPWDNNNNNDVALIFADGDQIVQVNKFQIFDRWGEMVFQDHDFQPNDPAHGWNGYQLGKLMVPAVFVYYAEILLIDGRVLLYKGDITLVR